MHSHRLPNHLRSHRKRLGLSQAEVAFLLGCRGIARISRYERFQRMPSFETALRYEAVFATPITILFPGLAIRAHRHVAERCQRLIRKLSRSNTPDSNYKCQMLATLIAS